MDFEEYVSANYKRLEGQTRELVEDAFKAGQQSKQAEIDKRLSDYQLEISQVGQACVKWKEVAEGRQAEIDALKAELAKREPMDLRSVDIPHGTIVLEK